MSGSTFRFRVEIPRTVLIEGRRLDREALFSWLWQEYGQRGLLGVHEGTVLTEDASRQGLETESWTVDSGEAPRERDWIGSQGTESAELYFDASKRAGAAARELAELGLTVGGVQEQPPEDWDAQWKAAFLASPDGVRVPPFWRVVPPWTDVAAGPDERVLRINPGAGFGTGTHETTQLCLHAIGEWQTRIGVAAASQATALDFGSGSGILTVALALMGARVHGVEIDPLAIDNALENARLNAMETRVRFAQSLADVDPDRSGPYPVVVANILKPVLLEFAEALTQRLAPGGTLILSGLIESDVAPVRARYSALLGGVAGEVLSANEWRAVVFRT